MHGFRRCRWIPSGGIFERELLTQYFSDLDDLHDIRTLPRHLLYALTGSETRTSPVHSKLMNGLECFSFLALPEGYCIFLQSLFL